MPRIWNAKLDVGKVGDKTTTIRPEDPAIAALQEERTKLLRKIQDSRKLVKRFVSQLHDTETFIKVSHFYACVR
jgi:hypothetical protein